MDIIFQIALLIIGFIILIKGADIFVDGASSTAENFKVPKMLIGLTIVAFGTSAPEFAVSVKSLLAGNGDMLLGNVIGSNILNILLIVGVASLVKPLVVKNNTVKKELPITLLMTAMLSVLMMDKLFEPGATNAFTRQDGIVILIAFCIFVYYLFSMARARKTTNELKKVDATLELLESTKKSDTKSSEAKNSAIKSSEHDPNEDLMPPEKPPMSLLKAIIFTIIGIAGIVIGSNFVVDSASNIASFLGVSQRLIALTIVALGTSLPELVTSIVATKKGECDIAIGNVVGSNIFNIGIVAGLPVAILGSIPQISFSYIDVVVMAIAAFLLFAFGRNDQRISRLEGAILLALFVVYYSFVVITGVSVA